MVKIGRCNEGNIIGHDLEIEKRKQNKLSMLENGGMKIRPTFQTGG